MSIEERLEQVELSTLGKGGEKGISTLQTDSYAVLLVQGLESKDKSILNVSPVYWPRLYVVVSSNLSVYAEISLAH